MIIQLQGTNFCNKGAELMLHAVIQQVKRWDANNIVTSRPVTTFGSFTERGEAGLYQSAWLEHSRGEWVGALTDSMVGLMPQKYRRMYGLILHPEIDAVFDASGFAFSDQWGFGRSEKLANNAKQWKKEGKKVILLPQAFGPFQESRNKAAVKRFLDSVDLLFARDQVSYEHLLSVGGKSSHIKIAPDFTNLVTGIVPQDFDENTQQACVIPSFRLMDKSPAEIQIKYMFFLKTCLEYLEEKGLNPFLLVHETTDYPLAVQVQAEMGNSVKLISESHPLKIKGILGKCHAVVSSRFHGLVSALSQGVPSLALGWSHKYKALLEDYACPECLVASIGSRDEIREQLSLITEETHRASLLHRLKEKGYHQKQLSIAMWNDVYDALQSKATA